MKYFEIGAARQELKEVRECVWRFMKRKRSSCEYQMGKRWKLIRGDDQDVVHDERLQFRRTTVEELAACLEITHAVTLGERQETCLQAFSAKLH